MNQTASDCNTTKMQQHGHPSLISERARKRAEAWGDEKVIITQVISGRLIEVPQFEK